MIRAPVQAPRFGGDIETRPDDAGRSVEHRGMAQSGSASALGAEGRGFESLCPDHSAVCTTIAAHAPVAQLDRASAF